MDDQITKNANSEKAADPGSLQEDENGLIKATPAHFLDSRLLLTILLVLIGSVAITALISAFQNSLGTISFGG